jgi:hypothetical protein
MFTQDGLHVGILEDDAEGFLHAGRVGGAAHVQEVGRAAAAELDDVHGGHGQAGAVHHAAHVAVQLHVVQARLAGLHLGGILLGLVTHLHMVRVAVQGVAVQAHLGIHGDDLVVAGLQHGVDLEHGAVAGFVCLVQGGHELGHLLLGRAGNAQVGGDLPALERAQAHTGIDLLLEDLLRRGLGHVLDVPCRPRCCT